MLAPLSEYYTSSSLFMSSSGVFLILTDSKKLLECNDKELEDTAYYSWIGSYMDLISNTAARAKLQPKIQLVVTKAEPEMENQIREACAKILEIAKKHLESVDADTTLFFLDEVLGLPVIPTSSHLYLVNSSLELIAIILKLLKYIGSGDQ